MNILYGELLSGKRIGKEEIVEIKKALISIRENYKDKFLFEILKRINNRFEEPWFWRWIVIFLAIAMVLSKKKEEPYEKTIDCFIFDDGYFEFLY